MERRLFLLTKLLLQGFEAAEKSKRWIIKIKECEEIRFLRWKVLTPFKCHFFLENQSKIILQ
jgi:hypothetical protein